MNSGLPEATAAASPAPHTPAITILVVNYNSGHWLQKCLDALRIQTLRDFEVRIIDNASTDQSGHPSLPDARFSLHHSAENLGFAAANNLLAKDTHSPWLALLNPDAFAKPDWLEQLIFEAKAHPEVAIFGSTQIRASEPAILDGTGDCLSGFGPCWRSGYGHAVSNDLPTGEVFSACGAAMMISRPLFESLGGFEERFFCYMEDVDLCFRARLAGECVWQSDRACVLHAGGASTESGESTFSMFHGYRNAIWMHLRCMPLALLAISLPGLICFTLLRMTRMRAPGQVPALWRGLIAGLRPIGQLLSQRRVIQAGRRVSTRDVAGWLSWNPRDILARRCITFNAQKKARP